MEKLGTDQCKFYPQSVTTDEATSIHETIKKNNLQVFSKPMLKPKGKQAEQVSMLKHDVEHLYIVMQHL